MEMLVTISTGWMVVFNLTVSMVIRPYFSCTSFIRTAICFTLIMRSLDIIILIVG